MSDVKSQPPQAMPLFYSRVAGINPQLHGHLRLDRSAGYGFAARAQSVPIALTEFESVAQHYPILFTSGANPVPVALLGLRDGENLFVQPNGQWRPDAYVPAYIRAFPFIFVEDLQTRQFTVGIEPDADQLRPDRGQPLFEDGRPSAVLSEAMNFCQAFREAVNAAAAFGRALDAAKLLEDEEATVNFTSGGSTKIRGFKLLKPERLSELDDSTFLDWRRMGYLTAAYAHMFSAGRWARLIDLGAPKPKNTPTP